MARRLEAWLAGGVLAVLMLYWLAWSIVGPVTNPDSLIYHLARLWLIEQTGLFHNTSYTWITQLILPWTFDAVHYPLLRLRYGYALPSFLCLVGIMGIVFAWVRERGDTLDGLRACLGLLSMPAVVMLATTTKNDLVLAFCLLCWIEALRRYAARPGRGPLLLAALALGFLAGSKPTGVLYGGLAAVVSLWVVRRRPRDAVWFGAALALMLVLNGSGEIYLNNYLQFGHWNGDPEWYRHAANNDGWRGFVASELRYATSALDLQLAPMDVLAWIADVKYRACQSVLEHLHLQGLGLMTPPWRRIGDRDLARQMATLLYSENRPTYGLIGTLLLVAAPIALVGRRRFDFPAWLFAGGVAAQVIVAATAGWHPANLRYFAAAACLAWAGVSLLLVSPRRRWLSLGVTIIAAAGAVLLPFRAAERSPANLVVAFHDRDALHRDVVRQIIVRAKAWKQRGELPVVLTSHGGPLFPLYDQLESNLILLPDPTEADLLKLDDLHHRGRYRIVSLRGGELKLPNLTEEESLPAYGFRVYVWTRP